MTTLDDAFPSKYLKAADLVEPTLFTIKDVIMTKLQDGKVKPVVSFSASSNKDLRQKELVLNVTNAKKIASLTNSKDFDDWTNTDVVLFSTVVPFAGEDVDAIRIRAPQLAAKKPAKPTATSDDPRTGKVYSEREPPPPTAHPDLDDEIPF